MGTILQIQPHFSNNYLVPLAEGYLLWDCDWPGSVPSLFRELKRFNVPFQKIRYLLISHYHPDHAGSAQELIERGVRLIIPEEQLSFIHDQDPILQKEKNAAFKPIEAFDALIFPCSKSRNFFARIGLNGQLIHTPGHSDDHMVLVLDDGEALIGDMIRADWAEGLGDERQLLSWQRILKHKPTIAYPGHGPSYSLTKFW